MEIHSEPEWSGVLTGHVLPALKAPQHSDWTCYLFGNIPGGSGIVYTPTKGQEPNWFVRWMMKVCLGCTWVKTIPGDKQSSQEQS